MLEEYPLSLETLVVGVERDPEASPTTTKLSLRLDEVEAMFCYVSHGSTREKAFMLGSHLGFMLATHLYSMPPKQIFKIEENCLLRMPNMVSRTLNCL